MRDRRGEPDPDRRIHHLPEAEQRGGRAGLLAERGERLRGAERIDDAHAEQEHADRAEERQEGRVEDRRPAGSRCCRSPPATSPPRIERSSPKRGASLVASMPAANTIMHGAGEEQAELDRREMQPFDQDARRRRKHREQPAHDQADGRGRNQEAAIGDQADIVLGDRERIERDPRRVMGFAEHRAIGDGADAPQRPRQRRIRSASRNSDRARRRAAARSRALPPSRS